MPKNKEGTEYAGDSLTKDSKEKSLVKPFFKIDQGFSRVNVIRRKRSSGKQKKRRKMWEEVARVLDGSVINTESANRSLVRLVKQQAAIESKVRSLFVGDGDFCTPLFSSFWCPPPPHRRGGSEG
jgi:hypothetical protein